MGKEQHHQQQNLRQQQNHEGFGGDRCCSMGILWRGVREELNFRCVFVLILCLCLLVSAIFTVFPLRSTKSRNGFEADSEIKLAASVQAYFRVPRPLSSLVRQIERMEYDILSEIGIPYTKVAILSMHQVGYNCTSVVFGVLADPINSTIDPVYLSVLRSSFIEIFHGQSNLSLTGSAFGQPSTFEILKFPGGITVIPVEYALIWQMPQILFNFTLNNSISEILKIFDELRDQLEFGLHLRPYEKVYVQITNVAGSTISSPVTIQASVIPDFGILLPQRLRQLALTITKSNAKNLGLSNSLFGRVKSVILSSYLKGTLHGSPVSPSPAPTPEPCDPSESYSPASSPSDYSNPCSKSHSSPQSPASPPRTHPSHPVPTTYLHPVGSPQQFPPDRSPSPEMSHSSTPAKSLASPSFAPSPMASSSSSFGVESLYRTIWLLGFCGVFIFHLLCWPS